MTFGKLYFLMKYVSTIMYGIMKREILGFEKSVLQDHISSKKKHQKGKDNLKKSKLTEQTIIEAFKGTLALCLWKNVTADLKWSANF